MYHNLNSAAKQRNLTIGRYYTQTREKTHTYHDFTISTVHIDYGIVIFVRFLSSLGPCGMISLVTN